jgi:hypothetical protein
MKLYSIGLIRLMMVIFIFFCAESVSLSTEIHFCTVKGKPGQNIEIPIIIDEINNLAGIKLVLKYDPELLVFKEGVNTKHSSSLMQIVNDKTPGRLILVMAGAKGIGGKDLEIMVVKFGIKKGISGNRTAQIEITELQLMDDQLKEINAKTKTGSVLISP